MLTKIKKKTEGFTIVEVMIVLAIAGLILLVVLLAVPALNRNARNNRRRTDVTALLGAINEYSNNSSGELPGVASDFTDYARLSFYEATDVDYVESSTAVGTDQNTVYVRTFAKCAGNEITGDEATRRNVVAYFFVETPGSVISQCQET